MHIFNLDITNEVVAGERSWYARYTQYTRHVHIALDAWVSVENYSLSTCRAICAADVPRFGILANTSHSLVQCTGHIYFDGAH
jgi:hypothetical protein